MELNEAKRLALELAPRCRPQWVELENGFGRVLAEDLLADRDVPEEARSRLDGYGLRSVDSAAASRNGEVVLRIKGRSLAAGGALGDGDELAQGECVRILTGAPVPASVDAVAAQEKVEKRNGLIALRKPLKPGDGIGPGGSDARKGEVLLRRGMVLTPSRLAIAAALGYAGVKVHARPRVALLATGDEVRELGEKLEGPLTFCNGRHLLAWLVRLHGGEAFSLGVAGDDPEEIVGLLRNVEADAVISTGGIGRGDRDFTLEAWKELDVETCFREINLSPGRNSALGLKESRTYWALPGNPWGAQLVFEELIRPALHRGLGLDECGDHTLPAALQAPLENPSGSYKAVRGKLSLVDGIARFYPQGRGAALLLQSMVENFAYTLLEPHVVDIPDGYMVRVRLHDFPPMAAPVLTHTTAHGV